ncbi:hypothetical protein [Mesorhizobium sp. B4-1-4]|uniref:hypothetical protein n=1 Tax=Mesorhizobium sp. B4-1-4 TaxID=2589888 RepID=UPI00112644FA|nr:hypothetical protein [Mesorhizobium sp. B4-1-4]UCI31907.1 hypothetical protein FJW03_29950 [Mesorhizobium sp. B4-1-4]
MRRDLSRSSPSKLSGGEALLPSPHAGLGLADLAQAPYAASTRARLQPSRWSQFKLSNDLKFVAKLRDVVGLYVDPPAHAIVLFRPTEEPNSDAQPRPAPPAHKKGGLGT